MPGQNRTGPLGMGAKTGRRMGLCGGTSNGVVSDNGQLCRGRGRGFGRCGNGNMLMTRTPDMPQKEQLAEQKEFLQAQLADVTARLEKLYQGSGCAYRAPSLKVRSSWQDQENGEKSVACRRITASVH